MSLFDDLKEFNPGTPSGCESCRGLRKELASEQLQRRATVAAIPEIVAKAVERERERCIGIVKDMAGDLIETSVIERRIREGK